MFGNAPHRVFAPHWWVDPANFLMIVTLPLFLGSGLIARPVVEASGSLYFLTPTYLLLGTVVLVVIAAGSKVGTLMAMRSGTEPAGIDLVRFDRALLVLLVLTIVAHLIYLGNILADPQLVKDVLSGEKGASFDARDATVRLPGLTTLSHLSNLVYCMSALRLVFTGSLGRNAMTVAGLLFLAVLVVAHAFLGSERLVLVENGLAFALPYFSFHPRFRRFGAIAPVVGFVAVVLLFAFGEYTRSWAYYSTRYDSFWGYVLERLLSYIALASNSGAGFIEKLQSAGPYMTATSLVRAPVIGRGTEYIQLYLTNYGAVEFNNPSGIFAPIVDYGVAAGLVFALLAGTLLGVAYGLYRKCSPVGLLIFPISFVGLVDLTQIWYWGGPRYLPQVFFVIAVALYTIKRVRSPEIAVVR